MINKWWFSKKKIKAVHENEFLLFLDALDILNEIKEGIFYCSICASRITLDNINLIYPYNNEIKFICDRITCKNTFNV
jgi:hypothetical protein